jgi:hypothetical protein
MMERYNIAFAIPTVINCGISKSCIHQPDGKADHRRGVTKLGMSRSQRIATPSLSRNAALHLKHDEEFAISGFI